MSKMLADSTLVPKDFIGKPGNVFIAMQWGSELGLKPMQAIQNIAPINGRPTLWGDAQLALVLASPVCKDVVETYEGQGDARKAVCVAQRHGRADKRSEFSVSDAKSAGLLNKQGPWTQYRDRMLKLRARAFALRDQFADVLKGMPMAEEVMDYAETSEKAAPLRVAASVQPDPSKVLIESAEAAAEGGVAAYQEFWRAASKEDRQALKNEHDRLKDRAQAVDAVVHTQGRREQADAVPARLVEDCLNAAFDNDSLDELHQAADMIRSVEGADHQSVLSQQYADLKEKLEARQ